MERVTVIAPTGAVVRGPAKVKISKAQHARRSQVLGDWARGGVFDLDGGQVLQFKHGEEFGIDVPGRLNRSLFSWEEEEAEAPDPDAANDGAPVSAGAAGAGASGPGAGDPGAGTGAQGGGA